MKFISLYFILFCTVSLLGQNTFNYNQQSPENLIFRLTEKEVEEIYTEGFSPKEHYFHTPISKTEFDSTEDISGYFIFAKAEEEKVVFSIKEVNIFSQFEPIIVNDGNYFSLKIFDKNGIYIENATVELNGEKVPFKEGRYIKKYRKENGILKIKYKDKFAFLEIYDYLKSGSNTQHPILRFFKNTYYRTIRKPVKWVSVKAQQLWGLISYGEWENPEYFGYYPKRNNQKRNYKGYIATNKPIYRHGDTLKVKIYVTDGKGRPLNKDITLRFNQQYPQRKKILQETIHPQKAGAYTKEIVIGDSISLDKTYYLSFLDKKENTIIQKQINIKDYELDEVNFSLSMNKQNYRDEQVVISASGKYTNGRYIPDGIVQLFVTKRNFYPSIHTQDKLQVKDTLWQTEVPLKSNGNTQIIIPDSIFPIGNLNAKVIANFYNSNNELHTKKTFFRLHKTRKLAPKKTPKKEGLFLRLEKEYIIGEYFEDGSPISSKGILYTEFENFEKEENLSLPFKKRINPNAISYDLQKKKEFKQLALDLQSAMLGLQGTLSKDSLSIIIENPRKLHGFYQLYSGKQFIEKGTFSKTSKIFKKHPSKKEYTLYCQYIWRGEEQQVQETYKKYKNKLTFTSNQPSKVRPGEKVQIKVKVKNNDDRPIQGVNLVAGAVNQKFKNPAASYQTPQITYKQKKTKTNKREFNRSSTNHGIKHKLLNKDWYQDFALDSLLYYQLRYPEKGMHLAYIPVEEQALKNRALFAPHIITNGQEQEIALIYINRQLVYYKGADTKQAFCFDGVSGNFNKIQVRTADQLYTFDRVFLKAGHKLEFSLETTQFKSQIKGINLRVKPMPLNYTPQEEALIRKSILRVTLPYRKTVYIQQNDAIYQLEARYGNANFLVGPLRGNTAIHYIEKDGFKKTVLFEHQYRYVVNKKNDKLYKETFRFDQPIKRNFSYSIGKFPLLKTDIKEYSLFKGRRFPFSRKYRQRSEGNGSLFLSYNFINQKVKPFLAILIGKDGKTYYFNSKKQERFHNLPPQYYDLYLLTEQYGYYQAKVNIKANTDTYQKVEFKKATLKKEGFPKKQGDFLRNYISNLILENSLGYTYVAPKKVVPAPYQSPSNQIREADKVLLSNDPKVGISGVVTDESGEPLIGANILIKGTTVGAITDFDGRYFLNVIPGDYTLEISYTGYDSYEIQIGNKTSIDAVLSEGTMLMESVVVGYGTSKAKKQVSVALQGKVADIQISGATGTANELKLRGTTSLTGNSNSLVVIDGVIQSAADLARLDPSSVLTINVLKGAEATAIYGAKGANGVIVIITQKGQLLKSLSTIEQTDIDVPDVQLRQNFKDYAYWQPNLITDHKGEAYFEVTYPDNLTSWHTFLIGMNRKKAGFLQQSTHAFKDITAQLILPRFLLKGDSINIMGKSQNFSAAEISINTIFKNNENIIYKNEALLNEYLTENVAITAPTTDTLTLEYNLRTSKYGDGEQRQLPVFPKGTQTKEGHFFAFHQDTTLNLNFDPSKGEVYVVVKNSMIDYLLDNIEDLKKYRYGCVEQTSSKLYALLLDKELSQIMGKTFNDEELIRFCINRLEKFQNEEGYWGWWQGGKVIPWITYYALEVLQKAQSMGYKTPAVEKTLVYIVNNLSSIKSNEHHLHALLTLSRDRLAKVYKEELAQYKQKKLNVYEQLLLANVKLKMNEAVDLDSLKKIARQTSKEQLYWENNSGYYWRRNNVQTTLLAYSIFEKNKDEDTLNKIRSYLLGQRNSSGWRNTLETAKVLVTILPHFMNKQGNLDFKSGVNISTQEQELSLSESTTKPLKINQHTLTLSKYGKETVYVSIYQDYLDENPNKVANNFDITTKFVQNKQEVTRLKTAQPTKIVATVNVKKDSEFVLIDIPIPAGCSATGQQPRYSFHESYREYFKDRVAIYSEKLRAGRYVFEVELKPKFEGKFSLNPVRVEEMYSPLNFGQNGLKRVAIGGR